MKKVIGGVLLAVGILLAGASGLCSLVVLFSNGGDLWTGLFAVLVFGGPFIAAGVGLALLGRWLIRRAHEEEGEPPAA